MKAKSINPYTQEIIAEFQKHSISEVEVFETLKKKICAAVEVNKSFNFQQRSLLLNKVAEILLLNKESYASLISSEMGKLHKEAIAEVEKCAWVCQYYAERAPEFLKDQILDSDADQSKVVYQPLGAILAVMPWNFPFWQVFRFAAPALMAGNVCLLKHASNVSGCALEIQSIFEEAGWGKGSFTTLILDANEVAQLIDSPIIKAITLTGSEYAGSQVASRAGQNIKKSVLELGGSDPFIVWKDCELEYTVNKAIQSRFLNSGQSCIAAKRFIVHEEIYNEFESLIQEELKKLSFATSPKDEGLAPMVSIKAKQELHGLVLDAVDNGAKCIVGGQDTDDKSAYYPATLLIDVNEKCKLFHEEAFGPVMVLYKIRNREKALKLSNATRFGLGASVWSLDKEIQQYFIENIDSGAVFVNEMVKSDPRLPFGGIKYSGFGRELAREGILEFVNAKTVYIK